jgi:hypothetical protein
VLITPFYLRCMFYPPPLTLFSTFAPTNLVMLLI